MIIYLFLHESFFVSNTDLHALLLVVRVIFGLFWISDVLDGEFPQTATITYLKLQYVWYFKGSYYAPYSLYAY